jgi:hypothetical protein
LSFRFFKQKLKTFVGDINKEDGQNVLARIDKMVNRERERVKRVTKETTVCVFFFIDLARKKPLILDNT